VTVISKGNRYLKAQDYTILIKVVDEAIWIHFLQFHNKLSSVQPALKELNSFPFLCII
jgi:hypothetical protein